MKISDYYNRYDWYPVRCDTKVYPVVPVEEDMGETCRDETQKGKRASEAYSTESKKFPSENLAPKGHNGVGVYLSIWV